MSSPDPKHTKGIYVGLRQIVNEGPPATPGRVTLLEQSFPVDAQGNVFINRPNLRFEAEGFQTQDSLPDGYYISEADAPILIAMQPGEDRPDPSGLHLERRGNDFVDAAGKRIVFPGIDGFDDVFFRASGRESELDALMKESQQIGMKVRRIWCMGDAGENQVFSLYPQNISGYFDLIRGLVAYENSFGIIPLFTAIVDGQRVMPDWQEKLRFWSQLHEALPGAGFALVSAVNQVSKNWGREWREVFQLPTPNTGIIWSRGSDVDDTQLPPRGAPASELHATRVSFDRALMDATASPPQMRKPESQGGGGSGMIWLTEHQPFGDAAGYTEDQAEALTRVYSAKGLWALAIHHNRQSQRGLLMHDDTARTATGWVRGMRLS